MATKSRYTNCFGYVSHDSFPDDISSFLAQYVWPRLNEGWQMHEWTLAPVAAAGGQTVGYRVFVWFTWDPDGDGVADEGYGAATDR